MSLSLVVLQELTEEELVQVLTQPKNALCKQYKQLFSLNKASFGATQGALRAIARRARDKGTGEGCRSCQSVAGCLNVDVCLNGCLVGAAGLSCPV
jgi:ATP-dependent protease Clp ATPase subunit